MLMPQVVSSAEMVGLVSAGRLDQLLPAWEDIPEEYKGCNQNEVFVQTAEDWCYTGIENILYVEKPKVNANDALRHLQVIVGAHGPSSEHKIAAVAYLLSIWFDTFTYKRCY